jgi:hypothetical protein
MCELCQRDDLPTETCGFEHEKYIRIEVHEFELCTECLKDREKSIQEYKEEFWNDI